MFERGTLVTNSNQFTPDGKNWFNYEYAVIECYGEEAWIQAVNSSFKGETYIFKLKDLTLC